MTTTNTLLANPTTHYMASDNGVLPNNPNTWIPFSSTITKTIYDPCPYGYRVPINGSWTGWATDALKAWTQYAITGGLSWPATNGGWWPASGTRHGASTNLDGIGSGGWYWSSSRLTSNVNSAYHLYFYYNGGVSPNYAYSRNFRFSVRCIERRK